MFLVYSKMQLVAHPHNNDAGSLNIYEETD